MKLPISTILLSLACIFVLLLFAGLECNENEPDQCKAFQSKKITWVSDAEYDPEKEKPLRPGIHFLGYGGANSNIYQYSNPEVTNVCFSEAVIYTLTIEFKADYKDQIYTTGGFLSINNNNEIIAIEHLDKNTSDGIYTVTGSLTLLGDASKERSSFSCVTNIAIFRQFDDDDYTDQNFDEMVIRISMDFSYFGQ